MEGGTGSNSEEETQPEHCPDRFESGTGNLPAIAGLAAGVDFIREKGLQAILEHELALATMMEECLAELPGVRVFRPEVRGTGTVSFTVDSLNPGDIGYLLDEAFDIAVRSGLHCAPLAHETLGSMPEGTVRASVGFLHDDGGSGILPQFPRVTSVPAAIVPAPESILCFPDRERSPVLSSDMISQM